MRTVTVSRASRVPTVLNLVRTQVPLVAARIMPVARDRCIQPSTCSLEYRVTIVPRLITGIPPYRCTIFKIVQNIVLANLANLVRTQAPAGAGKETGTVLPGGFPERGSRGRALQLPLCVLVRRPVDLLVVCKIRRFAVYLSEIQYCATP
eukprot:SAG31_NODE_808_length_11926_cov_13.255179_12_plen_150_part_00